MARNKTKSLKTKLTKARKESRVAPRWLVLKKYGGIKRAMHIPSRRLNPHKRRNWRKTSIKV